jgi:hypothetical protein
LSVDPVIAAIARVSLALLFAAAARHKLADWAAFRIVVHDYEILPRFAATPFAAGIVAVEAALTVALLVPATASAAATAAAALLATYTIAIAINLARGRRTLECGCAPSRYRHALSEILLVRNTVLIGVCGLVWASVAERAWGSVDVLTVAGGVVVAAATWSAAWTLLGGAAGRARAVASRGAMA